MAKRSHRSLVPRDPPPLTAWLDLDDLSHIDLHQMLVPIVGVRSDGRKKILLTRLRAVQEKMRQMWETEMMEQQDMPVRDDLAPHISAALRHPVDLPLWAKSVFLALTQKAADTLARCPPPPRLGPEAMNALRTACMTTDVCRSMGT